MTGGPDDPADKRASERRPVLRGAKIELGASVIDCLVLDQSTAGVRVSTDGPVAVPDEVTVELRSGARWTARRRWQRGTEIGLEFLAFAGLSQGASTRAAIVHESLRRCGLAEVHRALEMERFFEVPEVQRAAEAVQVAVTELDAVLKAASRRG